VQRDFALLKGMTETPAGLPPDARNVSHRGFNLHNGPIYELSPEGDVHRFAFVPERKHLNGSGNIHGGMLMGFADVAMSRTARAVSGSERSATVSLNCDFAGAGKDNEPIEARARAVRKTRTLVFLSAEIVQGGRVLAIATGMWKIA
jgi:uncharacterized protein (TIGR00369 family)